jgi:soluble cytochrome b562
MAVSIPIVSEFINTGIKQAERAFVDIRKQVAQAEGTMGKFKAAGKGVFDAVGANAASFAAAAGGALVTFAAQGVTAFQDLALSADKFAGATGLAVDEASRLMEVTGDLGIEAGTVETAIGKMNTNLGKSPDLFEELGVQVEYAKDGTVDANETFLNVIDRLNKIKDPAEKARVATQLLGKGWRDMSNLIALGSDDLRKSLATVSDAKTISPQEAEKARKFRDNMDDLKGVIEDLSLQIGDALVPAISTAVEQINKLQIPTIGGGFLKAFFGGPTDKVAGQMQMVNGLLQVFGVNLEDAGDKDPLITEEEINNMQMAATELDKFNQAALNQIKYARLKPFKELSTGADQLATELDNINEAWDRLVGNLNMTVEFDRAQQELVALEEAAAKAFATGAGSDIAAYNEAAAQFAGTLAVIAEGLGKIASREIKIRFEAEGGAAALALAAWYQSGGELRGLNASQLIGASGFSFGIPARAMGGPVTAGGTYLVGEQGPELLTLGARGGYVTPNHSLGNGGPINVTVTSADPNAVVAALQEWSRNNGSVPINTTANIRR